MLSFCFKKVIIMSFRSTLWSLDSSETAELHLNTNALTLGLKLKIRHSTVLMKN